MQIRPHSRSPILDHFFASRGRAGQTIRKLDLPMNVIEEQFLPLYRRVDQWLMLQAPSFGCVFRWRLEQEQKLANSLLEEEHSKLMNEKGIARFIQHYQRLTQSCLDNLPAKVHYLYQLDAGRNIVTSLWRDSIVE